MTDNIEAPEQTAPEAQKRKKKWPIIVGVVAVVLVAAGAGFMVWHEQPSFCNAICHDPMDPYVEEYYSDDKSLLAVGHRLAGTECLDCHEPTMAQQIAEGVAWVTGNYYVPLEKRDLATEEFCLNDSCHDLDEIKAATKDWDGEGFNPHDNHLSRDLECGDCHSVHRESTLYCNECHFSDVPEGWV